MNHVRRPPREHPASPNAGLSHAANTGRWVVTSMEMPPPVAAPPAPVAHPATAAPPSAGWATHDRAPEPELLIDFDMVVKALSAAVMPGPWRWTRFR